MACIGDKLRRTQFVIGIIQFFTTALVVGYIWGIAWGVYAIKKSH